MRGLERTDVEEAIAELAERQHGKVSRRQLIALGLGDDAIDYRLGKGWLRPDHRGVYSLGHRPQSREGRWMAAVLYGGDGAALSHWSAATLWRMRSGTGPRTHLTTPRKRRSSRTMAFHYARLREDEVATEQGIPTTTPARTLLDLAPLLPSPILVRMIESAPNRGATVADLVERYVRKPGVARLSKALRARRHMTRSDLEARVLDRIERAGLPAPRVNVVVEGYEVDYAWPAYRVIAELDTYVTHGSRTSFERDRERDRKLAIAGSTVARITDESGVGDLSRLLAATEARSRAAAW